MKALAIILILVNLLLPVAEFAHALAPDSQHVDILYAVAEDTHHPDHATLLSPSEYPLSSGSFYPVPVPLVDVILFPPDHSLHLPQVVNPILHPPLNLV
jgi:hypothetical protein